MCGKNTNVLLFSCKYLGSHPRVREKQVVNDFICCVHRITPACAGKTYPSSWNSQSSWDHPRVCGKNGTGSVNWKRSIGSHPRVREKQIPSAIRRPLVRITPACAGKTLLKNSFLICGSGSHPRVREKPL